MEHPKHLKIEDYTYALPDERIAKYPLEERDASKLLIYKAGEIKEDIYRDIAQHIPPETLLVFNQTKVVYARLLFKKPTGSTIEIFCLEPGEQYTDVQTAMLQNGNVLWTCLVGGAAKWKNGSVLQLVSDDEKFTLSASIAEKKGDSYLISFEWDDKELSFAEVLHHTGKVPLPPYLHRDAEANDTERYQTIFAKEEGSVAAPTAGLHFTGGVMDSLGEKRIDKTFVTLHVGAGTFKPIKAETLEGHDMHAEWIDVTSEAIEEIIAHLEKGVVAVGTTSLRTLESLHWIGVKLLNKRDMDLTGIAVSQWDPYEIEGEATAKEALRAILDHLIATNQTRLLTRTQILIAPGYEMKIVTGLVTNFHQPQSTLLLLVSALIGEDWRKVYDYALAHDYRFLSYGDGCLLWR